MSSEQPQILYRYQSFHSRTIDSLVLDQLYFADPLHFNDPLDCQPHVETNSTIDELRLILTTLIGFVANSRTFG